MWKLIIIAMLTGGGGAQSGGHIEIWESKFKTEKACQIAASKLGSLQGYGGLEQVGPFQIRAFCFSYR